MKEQTTPCIGQTLKRFIGPSGSESESDSDIVRSPADHNARAAPVHSSEARAGCPPFLSCSRALPPSCRQ